MRPVLVVLGIAIVGFLVYGVANDVGSVGYYVPITLMLAGVVALVHRSTGFSIGTLWALAAIAIGNLSGGVLLVGDAPLYEAIVLGPLRYTRSSMP